ncbi:MAG: YqgE/AlgH family protein [Planctomycetota bacterium]|nr:MAG: YqgE/AlgH family protein [Planctomycetota bacterium]
MARQPGGFLLVASPDLLDPNFRRTVALIVSHDEEGAFGLVLNRPLERNLADVTDDAHPRAEGVPLMQGGPVDLGRLQLMSSCSECGHAVLPGVTVGVSLEDLDEHEQECRIAVNAYVGYAGWGPGQLERETEEGSWIVAPAEARHVFDVPAEQLWATVLRELGGGYAWMALDGGKPSNN